MSYSHSKYLLNNKNYVKTEESVNVPLPESFGVNSTDKYSFYVPNQMNMNPRVPNVHLNPNSFILSGSVHINKSKFNINQSIARGNSGFDPRISTPVVDRIHYNPRFLTNTQQSLPVRNALNSNEVSKTIHINPSFAKTLNINQNVQATPAPLNYSHSFTCLSNSVNPLPSDQHACSKNEKIHINPRFVKTVDFKQDAPLRTLIDNSDCNTPSHSTNTCVDQVFKPQIVCSLINSKYRKVNNQIPTTMKLSPKISKYKIQRNHSTKLNNFYNNNVSRRLSVTKIALAKSIRASARKPRLSSSFKKIGKRKLVRKSLIQSYISSRRQTIPAMIQHSRNTIASRRRASKLATQTKYKFVRGETYTSDKINVAPKISKYKTINVPEKSKFKWNGNKEMYSNSGTQDFVKIGKRKIVRKSILQSILEARRSTMYHVRKYSLNKKSFSPVEKNKTRIKPLQSRYKVIRNPTSQQSSALLHETNDRFRKRNSSFSINKNTGPGTFNNAVKSKSILYRMPPSLRLRILLEEKRSRMMLLKKVNNKKKCMFYNRFGFCSRLEKGTCKKMHDSKSISVCKKYLKGLCDGQGCKLSHQVVPEKMPTCHQFLAGVCVRPSCPFLHVKLAIDRPICLDFLHGFCQDGDSCTKRHQFICPEWAEKASCKTEKCPYPHPSTDKIKKETKYTPKGNIQQKEKHKKPTNQSDTKNPLDDSNTRYFSIEGENKESQIESEENLNENVTFEIDSDENENSDAIDEKPEANDGFNSVYENESLLSFIPFS